ncbi:DUF1446-domain-containing protein [Cadophora sp. DSE1049]|nr:DUF1446-domain-containing protein [Cadophora sp. DSE1049]
MLHLVNQSRLSDWPYKPIIANAYIGQFAMVQALKAGTDIVIAGRATDAGTTQAIATWWHGWGEDDYDKHAMGLLAGHLIECGTYVTGGNFCGFKRIEPYVDLAFPIAEVHNDGHCVITKQPGQNGCVSTDTVRCQLVYEIQGRYYYNPDVIADLSSLTVSQQAKDRVSLSGFRGFQPPQTLKVAVQAYAGYQAEILIYAVGLDVEKKAESFELQTRKMLKEVHGGEEALKVSIELIGSCKLDPKSQASATTVIRVFAQATKKETLSHSKFMFPVIENLCQAFPGFIPNLEYLRTSQPKPYLSYFPCLLDRAKVDMQVHFLGQTETMVVRHGPGAESIKQEDYEPKDPLTWRHLEQPLKFLSATKYLRDLVIKGQMSMLDSFPRQILRRNGTGYAPF